MYFLNSLPSTALPVCQVLNVITLHKPQVLEGNGVSRTKLMKLCPSPPDILAPRKTPPCLHLLLLPKSHNHFRESDSINQIIAQHTVGIPTSLLHANEARRGWGKRVCTWVRNEVSTQHDHRRSLLWGEVRKWEGAGSRKPSSNHTRVGHRSAHLTSDPFQRTSSLQLYTVLWFTFIVLPESQGHGKLRTSL